MLRIGEFSRLSQVTIKALRHYDEIGLLQPSQIDPFTNYRYYTLDQLARLHRIMVLKELGLSLEQIAQVMTTDLSVDQLKGMLALKQAEMQQRIDVELAQLARVKFHIRQIELEAYMSKLDVRIKKVEPTRALTFRQRFPTHAEIDKVGRELQKALQVHKVGALEPWFSIVYADEYDQHNVDLEFVIPVNDAHTGDVPMETAGVLTLREIPGIEEAATYIYEGDPDNVNEVLVDLQRWVAANGYKLSGMIRMVMLRGPKERLPANQWLTEIQHPLEKA